MIGGLSWWMNSAFSKKEIKQILVKHEHFLSSLNHLLTPVTFLGTQLLSFSTLLYISDENSSLFLCLTPGVKWTRNRSEAA